MRYPPRLPRTPIEITPNPLNLSSAASKEGCLNIYGGTPGTNPFTIYNGAAAMFTFDIDNTKLTLNADIEFVGTQTIKTTANGDLKLIPNGTGITIIGDAGSTSHSLAANDDLFISGKMEVDGASFFDSTVVFGGNITLNDNINLSFGSGPDALLDWSTAQATENTLLFALATSSRTIIFADTASVNKDFDHGQASNPTIFVHSAVNPDTDNTQWISFYHNQTDGLISCGKGMLDLSTQIIKYPFELETHTPSAANDTGIAGAICWDAAYVYICVGTDEWERVAIASW